MNKLQSLLDSKDWLLADGAMGTNLFAMGLKQGDPPETWNTKHPEKLIELHSSMIAAGADIILTNSFGGTRNRLKLHPGLENDCFALNKRAAELASEAVKASGREVVIAGSMGPTGDLYEPIGPLSIAEGATAFKEQAEGLAAGGADVLWLETLSSLEEVEAAITGASGTGLPFVVTVSFDSNGKTMMGLSPAEFADWVRRLSTQPIAFGANCGSGTPDLAACLLAITEQGQSDVLVAKSNAGIPEFKDGEFVYSGTPEHMAKYALIMRDMGAKIIGGCCGTTAEHLKAMRTALEQTAKAEKPSIDTIQTELGSLNLPNAKSSGRKAAREGRRGRRT